MPQKGLPFLTSVNKYIGQFPDLIYTGSRVHCRICNAFLVNSSKHACKIHVRAKKHIISRKNVIPYWKFLYDFIFMMSVCNIPHNIVESQYFRLFWRTYIPQWTLPTRNQLRYKLPQVKNSVETLIKTQLKNKTIWITLNETKDVRHRSFANILVRTLDIDGSSHPYLLCSRKLQQATAETVVTLIKETLQKFGVAPLQVLMLVSDGAAYMLKAGIILKTTFPHLLHITCIIEACHLVAETVRNFYPAVDRLIFETEKVFVKSPKRVREFRSVCPRIPLPPQPVPTRWGTWLEAVLYYNKYYTQVKSVILKFNPQEVKSIHESQQLFQNSQVEEDIGVISQQYSVLIDSLSSLQNPNLMLEESLHILENLQISLKTLTDIPGQHACDKLYSVLNKNPDYKKLLDITNHEEPDAIWRYVKFASVTCYDAEKSFSNYYTDTFSQFRRKLTESNIEGLLMLHFYAKSINQTLTFHM